ncbi:MAG TPA: methyltransferase domain-containing protein [Thermoleophilaceae bacterium]|nr:methyltransferase domain-containing protein [Thermoleophilaceae bacterium]
MSQLVFDDRIVEQLEVLYRSRDVLRRRRLVYEALGARPGDRILDVGCGPGFYSRELLDQVGQEGSVTGVDQSPQMLAVAKRRSEAFRNVRFEEGDATSLPVDSGSFDRALSVQVLEYVHDVPAALAEMHRALRTGGRVVLWDVDWATVSWHSADPGRMARVLEVWDDHLADPSLPRTLTASLRAAGFEDVRMDGHAFATAELSEETYGGSVLPVIERYVESQDAEEVQAWADEQRALGQRGEFYFACMQFCFSGVRPG